MENENLDPLFQNPNMEGSINQPLQPPEPRFYNKKPSLLILIGLVVTGVAFGFVIWQRGGLLPPLTTPTPTAIPNPTADWQTYRSEEYGFEFKYPEDLVMIRDFGKEGLYKSFNFAVNTLIPNNHICLQGAENSEWGSHEELPCTLYFTVNDFKEKTLSDYVAKNMDMESIKAFGGLNEEITIGDNKWAIAGSPEGPGIGNWALFILNESRTKVITIWVTNVLDIDAKKISAKANEILSTFKFIEPGICIQVITPARNPQTGEVRNFPTPCDVPEGWESL